MDFTDYALAELPGGVVGIELSGYGDPSLETLRALSGSGAAAVARSNIQAHHGFGWARAGTVVFDDDEYAFAKDPESFPLELQPCSGLLGRT